ncbi:methyltransferase domain-containing protein [candidate division GN15 bacterium]|nr:methyltransferase domain-containing protein [candidate division GN15 bacterium]
MTDKSKWERFFDTHAPKYDKEVFAQNTEAEIPFLIEVLALEKGASILDIGCGTGRHTVGLARAGYKMTGLDLSAGMLAQAEQRAEAEGVTVEFIKADASRWRAERQYDAVICLCEGAMCLITEDDDPFERDQRLLRNIAASVKPGGTLVINALNGLKIIRQVTAQDITDGRFDPVTMTERSDASTQLDDGTALQGALERWYTPAEFVRMIREAGFDELHVWGGEAGNWRREPPSLDEYEIMVVARRKA